MTDPAPARRGERPLDIKEFQRHVAQAVGLEHVGVLLGAGASVGCGGQTMARLWSDFERDHAPVVDQLASASFIECPFIADGPPNVEQVIDALTVALMDARRRGEDTSDLTAMKNDLLRAVLRAAILDNGWLCDPTSAASDPRLADHVRLLTRLARTRQPGQPAPWVFTTNYDMAIELAAESASLHVRDGFRGFHHRVFTPSAFDLGLRNTEARGEAQFGTYEVYLAKLHGSLSWQAKDGDVRAVQIATACKDVQAFLRGETQEPPSVLVFPSSAKFVDTVGFVYGELMRRLTHFLARPNICLIVGGYGFGDGHLNRILLSALNNPTLQLIVYLPEVEGFDANGTPTNEAALSASQRSFLRLKLPQVTVIGGKPTAFFDQLASHLPDPTLLDDPAERARKIATTLRDYLADGGTA